MARTLVDIIRHAAIYISEEMGVVLRNTAYSPNIRDRLDYSCSILSPVGDLIAQAEHIPVHLGSMAVGVKATVEYIEDFYGSLEPGDIIIVNDPYIAGTHLNDVLLLKPVYAGDRLVAIVANKAHHVDVGGSVPGSLGGSASELMEEGIVIPPVKLAERGRIRWDLIRVLEENVRTPSYLRGDLRAQLASLNVGEKRVSELVARYGVHTVLEAWNEIVDYTERYARARIESLGVHGAYEAVDYMELGDRLLPIKARVVVESGSLIVDYKGSHLQVDAPINAVYGVTVAATVFALKSIIDPEMPVNQGFHRVVRVEAPKGTIVNPVKPAPVSGGNTETSQRIVDVVYKALAAALPDRVPAASCGSMTNLAMGGRDRLGRRWAFYETIACGSGARPNMDGVDGVHTNMTNTLNTPIERLEAEHPVLVVEYRLRPDSEGPGARRGGLGVIRALRILSGEARVTVLGERCITRPWGLAGGAPGEPARHMLVRSDGEVVYLPCKTTVRLQEGDTIYINTPGGGGYGDPCRRPREDVARDVAEGRISLARAALRYCYRAGESYADNNA